MSLSPTDSRRRSSPRRPLWPVVLGTWLIASPTLGADPGSGAKVDFDRDVRPILSNQCFQCHGPDDKRRKGELRLDTPTGVFEATKSGGKAVVPGDLEESELYLRITEEDDSVRMPPPKSGKALNADQVAKVRAWIEQGAEIKRHWAFTPPQRPTPPSPGDSAWCRNPIDAFVLDRLERDGLHPSPEAGKTSLLRRLSLDLIGLPPTIEELDAFRNDASPDAYENQVTRLLASPHYGERWGRVWLDAARYADSDGYEKDKPRQVWAYRDWVINALNRDLPYDEFIIDQIAGDLLESPSQDQKVATGFLRNSMINEEGGADPEQFRMEAMFDRMEAIGKGVLGLTIQCAQCHTHKFDPLTHEEYYRMFAYLNDSYEASTPVYSPQEQMRRAALFQEIEEIEAGLKHRNPDWPERMADWERSVSADQTEWLVVRPEVDDISTGGQKYLPQEDGSFLAQGYAPTKHRVKLTVKVDAPQIHAFRLELLNHPDLPLSGPGRSIKGMAALTEFEVEAAPADAPTKVQKVRFSRASADVNPPETPLEPIFDDKSGKGRVTGPAAFAIDGKDETAWGIDVGPGRRNQGRKAVFVAETPIEHPGGTILTISLKQFHGGWNSDDNQSHNLGRFRLSISSDPKATADPLPASVREILAVPSDRRTPAQVAAVFRVWRAQVEDWKDANDRIEALWRQHPEGSSQLMLQERERSRATHILQRGDFLKPGETVGPGVPAFLNPLPADAPPNRLGFARWLVARDAPTTARALVNRVWQSDFGTGLVATSEDLGIQSEVPSHPELLDWLAVEFMDAEWSLKSLHHWIVTSATYRQSSKVTPELLERDPYNRLLARGPRLRVDAEIVRDIALAASGLLTPKVGGPSVFPPAPAFLFLPPTSYGPKVWHESTGPDRYRRALYTFRFRSVPYPMLQTFDAPNGDSSCVRRARSNTPLQALTTLNEPLFLECARALALRTLRSGGETEADRLAFAVRSCLARTPTDAESAVLLGLLHRQEQRFADGGSAPWTLAADQPDHPPQLPEGATSAQLAAWTVVSRVLLNLDETITKD